MARPRSDIQHRVLRAAAERFLHDGVDGASLRQIAHEAGTSVGMVSYYFATKEDLFVAVVEDKYRKVLGDITAAMAPDAPFDEQVRRLYARFAALDDEEFLVVRVVMRELLVASPRMPALIARFSEGHVPVVFAAVMGATARGELRPDVHPAAAMIALFASGVLPQIARRLVGPTLARGVELPAAEVVAEAMRDVLFKGLAAGVPSAIVPITVQVTAPVARALRGLDAPTAASRALADRAAVLGVTLRPQHARAADAPLVGFFAAEVRDRARVEATLTLLREDPSVEGAWQTPDDQLPQ